MRIDYPAYPTTEEHMNGGGGLSVREIAAIQLRVPDSGDEQIDAMIRQANRRDFAGQAMAGILANDVDGAWLNDDGTLCNSVKEISSIIARHSCTYADALIEELNR